MIFNVASKSDNIKFIFKCTESTCSCNTLESECVLWCLWINKMHIVHQLTFYMYLNDGGLKNKQCLLDADRRSGRQRFEDIPWSCQRKNSWLLFSRKKHRFHSQQYNSLRRKTFQLTLAENKFFRKHGFSLPNPHHDLILYAVATMLFPDRFFPLKQI